MTIDPKAQIELLDIAINHIKDVDPGTTTAFEISRLKYVEGLLSGMQHMLVFSLPKEEKESIPNPKTNAHS